MQTSILTRFTAELCDCVIGANDSAEQLEALARSNLFLVSLDGHGEWFRYHNLFRELVHAELVAGDRSATRPQPPRRRVVRRAWPDRGRARVRVGDGHPRAADLLQTHYLDLARAGKFTTFTGWLSGFPTPCSANGRLLIRQWGADVDDGGPAGTDPPSLRDTRRSGP